MGRTCLPNGRPGPRHRLQSVEDLLRGQGPDLQAAIERGDPLTKADWQRALLATEIVFASDGIGAGWDWHITTGITDEDTIRLLRTVQRTVSNALSST